MYDIFRAHTAHCTSSRTYDRHRTVRIALLVLLYCRIVQAGPIYSSSSKLASTSNKQNKSNSNVVAIVFRARSRSTYVHLVGCLDLFEYIIPLRHPCNVLCILQLRAPMSVFVYKQAMLHKQSCSSCRVFVHHVSRVISHDLLSVYEVKYEIRNRACMTSAPMPFVQETKDAANSIINILLIPFIIFAHLLLLFFFFFFPGEREETPVHTYFLFLKFSCTGSNPVRFFHLCRACL